MMDTEGDILKRHVGTDESVLIPVGRQVELELEGVMAKMKSSCAGAISEECLIFKHPNVEDSGLATDRLFEGRKITVRYVDRGNVFTFQSKLLGSVVSPVKLIFVAYPTMMARHSLRKVHRVDYPLFAEVDINDEQFEGLVKDISVKGCRLSIIGQPSGRILPEVKAGQMLSIRIALQGIDVPIAIAGQVKSFQMEDQRITVGIAFHDVEPEVRDRLSSFISSIQESR